MDYVSLDHQNCTALWWTRDATTSTHVYWGQETIIPNYGPVERASTCRDYQSQRGVSCKGCSKKVASRTMMRMGKNRPCHPVTELGYVPVKLRQLSSARLPVREGLSGFLAFRLSDFAHMNQKKSKKETPRCAFACTLTARFLIAQAWEERR